ncbi:MAG TPA: endonuclease Q family protein, partial [Desulfobacteraceae bacterium]|nr:endonuclease Q family protein [Desulfobacteraceae bacterium]
MKYFADLHLHSHFARATAKTLDLEHMYQAAQLKGITLVGTGDFTHPGWLADIREKLVPAEQGLFKLKNDIAAPLDRETPQSCRHPVRFILQCEISSIYKKEGKVRKNHNLVYFPDIAGVTTFNARLDHIGNLASDGRPILGLDCERLLEIVLETSDEAFLVPAHIWTPWFSMFGAKSGFDSIQECFGSLAGHIFAAETGLSSDPPMNWRVADLDRVTLVSSSDAHSPMYMGRNASVFTTDLSYAAVRQALETGDLEKYRGTVDMYPQEGKYHFDGHRKCNVCLNPREAMANNGLCPQCRRPLTPGVLNRVQQLATRPEGYIPDTRQGYQSMVPLVGLLSEICGVGPKTKKVAASYNKALAVLGPELAILLEKRRDEIEKAGIPLLAEAIARMRKGAVKISPGFDGEYGRVSLFDDGEKEVLLGE